MEVEHMAFPPSSPLARLFDFAPYEAVAIMGSGGKTTLLWHLAQAFRAEKVLVTPTTKLFRPSPQLYDRLYDATTFSRLPEAPVSEKTCGLPLHHDSRNGSIQSLRFSNAISSSTIPQTVLWQNGFTPDSPAQKNILPHGITPDSTVPDGITPDDLISADLTSNGVAPESIPLEGTVLNGITLAGQTPPATEQPLPKNIKRRREVENPASFEHKILPLPPELLARHTRQFDKVFMECDGARNLPLKGWSPSEPVIPPFTTTVIAVIPLWAVGLQASDATIHRAKLFYDMAQCRAGETITVEHLARIITHPNGLLAKASQGSTNLNEPNSANAANIILFLHSAEITAPSFSQTPPSQFATPHSAPGPFNQPQPSQPQQDSERFPPTHSHTLAHTLLALLPQAALSQTHRIITGSAKTGWGVLLHA